jgi:hypothetical protein
MFKKAERKQSKLRLCLTGPSGAGKTYSALQIARGLSPKGKIAVLDSENGSSELYSNITQFDVAVLKPPFHPQNYIEMINTAVKANYDVLIIDSLSHCYNGVGGLLDLHQQATMNRRDRNSFAAWGEITPIQNRLIDTILSAPLHIISTLRTKTAWEVIENDRGKKAPVKVGLSPIQREGLDYEFSVVFDLSSDGHVATASKDRTGLFDGEQFTPSVDTGKKLHKWLNIGKDQSEASTKLLVDLQSKISSSDTLSSLKTVWQENEQIIEDQLVPEHIDALKAVWLSKKQSFTAPINNHPSH